MTRTVHFGNSLFEFNMKVSCPQIRSRLSTIVIDLLPRQRDGKSTPSASSSNDLPDLKFKILVSLIKSMMCPAYKEIVNVAQVVRESDLDWTLVRVSILNNAPKSGIIKVGYLGTGEVGVRISRADIAGFILEELKNGKYINQMPVISN